MTTAQATDFDNRCRAACESIWRDATERGAPLHLDQYCEVLTPILREYFSQLYEDSERLSYLELVGANPKGVTVGGVCYWSVEIGRKRIGEGDNLREAIDAAMAAESGGKSPAPSEPLPHNYIPEGAMIADYSFTQEEAQAAYDEWGCNCGPSALAFALQRSLDDVRPLISGFDEKRYTSPSMMAAALKAAGVRWTPVQDPDSMSMFDSRGIALVRIQWTGPWTQPGANPKWAYRYTHWIATWIQQDCPLIFDVNGGVLNLLQWAEQVIPLLIQQIPRADGGWFPTHAWVLG